MIKIGMIIGDRYEILEKIGTGGMSDVYKAKCHKLNRYVAVKVLKQEFSENENFVSKFQTEAQAAAGLAHPNIVNVYDVGEEQNIHYIVMELVEGITLKKYIEKKARLSFKEAVSIAIQVSMGIQAAHNNHIIHRDIKPQNIIISKDGKVKVTDFGIAKAATSNTITSNVMGSVHYTSPEQARGGYSDEKSDIYSLGITMFEMLTGRVPFNGETTVAIAIKHIQEEMPSPKEFVPEIPNSVESIVLKCCQKSPDRRYQNMEEVIADLKQSLMNPDEDFVVFADPDLEGGTRAVTDGEMEQIKNQSRNNLNYGVEDRESGMRLRTQTEEEYDDYDGDDELIEDGDPKMERITTIMTIVAGIVILIIILILAIKLFGMSPGEKKSPFVSEESSSAEAYETMPDVKLMNLEDAKSQLEKLGFVVVIEYQESDTVTQNIVIRASEDAFQEVAVGTTITLVVSSGSVGVEVASVTGKSYEEASSALSQAGFRVSKVEAYSDEIEAGLVITQSLVGGSKAPAGSSVVLTVSKGKEIAKVPVPDVIGKTEMDGTVVITESGLKVGTVTEVFSSEYDEGIICYQSYSSTTPVDPGTAIDLKVSKGKEKVSYKCNISIDAPSVSEASDYTSGTEVHIEFVTDNGESLLDTWVTSFPQSANYYGISCSAGTITMTYTVNTPGGTELGPNGETISTSGTTETKSFTRRVEFKQE